MSRRARAAGFASAAAVCAGLAAGASGGGATDGAAQFGELREVVVAGRALAAHQQLGRELVADALEVRRVPERFVPPGALTSPAQALGHRTVAPVPAGSYLLSSIFQLPRADGPSDTPELAGGRRPVEITVAGAGALAGSSGGPGRRVDVIVTTEASPGGGAGRTFVAAAAVGLLDLRPASDVSGTDVVPGPPSESWIATLALTRAQALRLIHAQSFAREVRLIGR